MEEEGSGCRIGDSEKFKGEGGGIGKGNHTWYHFYSGSVAHLTSDDIFKTAEMPARKPRIIELKKEKWTC